jgi:CheY-like chemotaxis protein
MSSHMATLTALCSDEATIVLCSRLRRLGFDVGWLYADDLRQGRIGPEAFADVEPPDLLLYDLDEPVDESLMLLTLFRSIPGMADVPVVLLRMDKTRLPPLDAPGIAAVLTRPCEAGLARTIIEAALRDGRGLDEAA